jgi:hypothetical protein
MWWHVAAALVTSAGAGPLCEDPRLTTHRGVFVSTDELFEAPDLDPWPGLTPTASSAAWARVVGAVRAGQLPAPGAARPEELVAALPADDPPPPPGQDLVVRAETARSPWDADVAFLRLTVTARRPRPLDRAPVHLAVVVDSQVEGEGMALVRTSLRELAGALRPDDTVLLLDSAGGMRLPPALVGDGEPLRLAAEALRASPPEEHVDLPQALASAYQALAHLPSARVMLLSDGDLSLIEQGDELGERVARGAADGVGFVGLGHGGPLYGRDEGVESLVRAAGGTYLHLGDEGDAREQLGDHLGTLIEPVLADLRLLVDWGAAVRGVHRSGHHHERLTGLGPAGPVGRELGAGRTASVVYEIQLAPGASPGVLGRVLVRSTPVRTGQPRTDELSIPAPSRELSEASAALRLAVAASTFGELLGRARPLDRAEDVLALAVQAQRPEYPQDAELVEMVRLATPMLRAPRCW